MVVKYRVQQGMNGSVLQQKEGKFTSFFKDKKSKRSHKTVGIKGFLTILA
jgi:hypothetical protein